jgi:hypothetical protein
MTYQHTASCFSLSNLRWAVQRTLFSTVLIAGRESIDEQVYHLLIALHVCARPHLQSSSTQIGYDPLVIPADKPWCPQIHTQVELVVRA